MISYDDALQRIMDSVTPLPPIHVLLDDAPGHVLALPAKSRWDMPRFDNSAMDGFALAGLPEKTDVGLAIVGASYAGHPFPGKLYPGQAVHITTGAQLPPGADTVIPLEQAQQKGDCVYLIERAEVGQHVRYRGEEYCSRDVLLDVGARLRAGDVALLASAGIEYVTVFPRPRVAVISTGDELVELGQDPGPDKIINSNLHLLKTRLSECGCIPICLGIGADDPGTLDQLFDQALSADVIISTGGVSVGVKDHVQAALEKRDFRKVFWKVAIKPGKPVLFGMLESKPCFGLPGNPAATAATFELFVKPALKRLAGETDILPERRRAILTSEVMGGGERQTFLWCRLKWQERAYIVTLSQCQGSGQNRGLSTANALLSVPVGVEKLGAGEDVEVLLL
ncbi:MAG: molybdopterin molybdotransferase MoeA [Desulfuromonadales bacterium]|nr:molybdopterin molybdotransferase MoeA [Desulfuromonadales bacterium]